MQLINRALLDQLLQKAAKSPRRRINHNFHTTMDENPHRFLNVMLNGSYFTPHRHLKPPKTETFLVLEGKLAFFTFEDDGRIQDCRILGSDLPTLGIDIPPGTWHTLLVLSNHCVCFEVKPGPYIQAEDKEFAPWAPHEGSNECSAYLEKLEDYLKAT